MVSPSCKSLWMRDSWAVSCCCIWPWRCVSLSKALTATGWVVSGAPSSSHTPSSSTSISSSPLAPSWLLEPSSTAPFAPRRLFRLWQLTTMVPVSLPPLQQLVAFSQVILFPICAPPCLLRSIGGRARPGTAEIDRW
eukprot:CAMPEP_0115457690 /NCGR_PEP_ID=MMETSP0271-20121206/45349_1 /TAXON_ID=71861 /ORGANISM="Scrippsiella trochoidea, Strain CCMP3099" /LENGTH=136 /DNA_ID=CAMNT_0002884275 /DNA_START=191 /DNA_END=601 /DNA_ORIENTATION=+